MRLVGSQYTLKIVDGDIAIRGDGNATVVSGAERVAQDLACWCMEPVGSDPMYPRFGSDLNSRIGEPNTPSQRSGARAEVARVCSNYVAYQQQALATVGAASYALNWSPDDIVSRIDRVDVSSSRDTISIGVSVRTSAGSYAEVSQIV